MRILLTNDDGILAPGLVAARRRLADLGEVTVVAPTSAQSAVGHSISVANPLFWQDVQMADGTAGTSVDGSPADCVKLAVLEIMADAPPELVVSGINHGENVGINVLYSGTVAAAVEGAFYSLPAMAVSLAYGSEARFDEAAAIVRTVVGQVIERIATGGPQLLNVNVPDLTAGPPKGVRVCRMGTRPMDEQLIRRRDPRGRPYVWMEGTEVEPHRADPQSDQLALAQGYVTVTPLQFDLTDGGRMEEVEGWGLAL